MEFLQLTADMSSSDLFETYRCIPEAKYKLIESKLQRLRESDHGQSREGGKEQTAEEMRGAGDLPSRPPQFITPSVLGATGAMSAAPEGMSHTTVEDPNKDQEFDEQQETPPVDHAAHVKSGAHHKKGEAKKETMKPELRAAYYLGEGPFPWTV